MLYRVEVTVYGVIQVEAESAEEAEKITRAAMPTLQGKRVYGHKIEAKAIGFVENTILKPDNVVQLVTKH